MTFLHSVVLLWTLSLATGQQHTAENVALLGRATQSTNLGGFSYGQNAIDGNKDSQFGHGSCFSSQLEQDPWWRVDLLKSYDISHINITNRGDCCEWFLNGAEIHVGDSLNDNGNNNTRFAVISSIERGATQTYKPKIETKGRYVTIILRKLQFLTFCEVGIYKLK